MTRCSIQLLSTYAAFCIHGMESLRQAVDARAFGEWSLRRKKDLVSYDFEGKGFDIIWMWKKDQDSFSNMRMMMLWIHYRLQNTS